VTLFVPTQIPATRIIFLNRRKRLLLQASPYGLKTEILSATYNFRSISFMMFPTFMEYRGPTVSAIAYNEKKNDLSLI